jgi:hypothetical protein
MNKALKRKHRPHSPVAPLSPWRDAALVVGALLVTALTSSPAVAVSPTPPPPEFFAAPDTGEALWSICAGSAGPVPPTCSAYIVGASDGVASAAASTWRPYCLSARSQADDLAEIVRRYIGSHPQSRRASAVAVVTAALSNAYPCRPGEQR